MYDLKKSFGSLVREMPVATGFSVSREGLALIKVMEGGIAKVRPGTGAATDIFCGFSTTDNESVVSEPRVENVTVPTASPYTVQLSSTTPYGTAPASYEIRVYNADTSAASTQTAIGSIGANLFNLGATGVITVTAAYAGDTLNVFWRVVLTALEAQQKYYQRHPNNTAGALLGQVGVLCGQGEIFTYEYDTAVTWSSVSAGHLIVTASGMVTSGTGGTYNLLGHVIKVPSTTDASLGIAFNVNRI